LAKITAAIHRTREKMFSFQVFRELPYYRSYTPQIVDKERRGDVILEHLVLLGFGI
jgi:hypothetical protein